VKLLSEKYHLMAEEWEARAKRAHPDLRKGFLEIAKRWREMAKDADVTAKFGQRIEKSERDQLRCIVRL